MGKLETLGQWCKANGILIDERLFLVDSNGDISVHSTGPDIDLRTIVVQIPKHALISVKTSGIAELQEMEVVGREAQLALALCLYVEMSKGQSSRWCGYLQSLPASTIDIPMFWPHDEEAIILLRNSEVEKKANINDELDTISRFFDKVVKLIFPTYTSSEPSLERFQHAYSLVSSRAFMVDAYHGLSMVPIADAFNHSQENHVHLESEYDVCPECGTLSQCRHDDPPHTAPSADTESDYVEMVTNTVVPAGQVFNTYGDDLTNADLLIRYGFISDVNENDRVTWDLPAVEHSLDISALKEAELVHSGRDCCIDSEGLISDYLFFHLAGPLDQVDVDGLLDSPEDLTRIANTIVAFCLERKLLLANVDNIDLDSASTRVKRVALEILSERSILENCISRWREFLEPFS